MKSRYLYPQILESLQKKMVFLGGPRQVGKTSLSLLFLDPPTETNPGYLNWDAPGVSKALLEGKLPEPHKLIIFDEIHKYKRWRNLVKGIYDTQKSRHQFLVTGSARLDHFAKGGDSLLGRYFYYRLHPFSVCELNQSPTTADLDLLLKFGGFPEPLFSQDESQHRIWQRSRLYQVVREDLRDLANVKEISLVELLARTLPDRVGSILSIANLKEDLQVDHKTIVRWISILESLYYCFRISPYGAPKIKAVKKEQKLYMWDWSQVEAPGPRFENLVASQLLKYCHWIEDTEGHEMELRYLRDVYKKEVDFVVLKNRRPIFAVECKTGDKSISEAVRYFSERTPIPRFFQVHLKKAHYEKNGVEVIPFVEFCKELSMP